MYAIGWNCMVSIDVCGISMDKCTYLALANKRMLDWQLYDYQYRLNGQYGYKSINNRQIIQHNYLKKLQSNWTYY